MAQPAREAALKRQAASLYPYLPAGIWTSAGRLAALIETSYEHRLQHGAGGMPGWKGRGATAVGALAMGGVLQPLGQAFADEERLDQVHPDMRHARLALHPAEGVDRHGGADLHVALADDPDERFLRADASE